MKENTLSTVSFSLNGRVALVTGASSGIGRALAKGLSAAGAQVVAVARRADRLGNLVGEIEQQGGDALAAQADVTDMGSIHGAFDAAERMFGVVDIIVNNAGISVTQSFLESTLSERDAVIDTNVKGAWNVAQIGAQRMVDAKKQGAIINIASVLGFGVQPGLASYCSSKGAIIQLTRSMAIDLMRHSVRVNAVAPGWFRTELNDAYFESPAGQDYIKRMPARRLGKLNELVGPVVFLASEAGSFTNGSVLTIDGALSALIA
jgi:NAD(P)-dependent dehydrogenase (short-subunit alcohol dehydrogenase family)